MLAREIALPVVDPFLSLRVSLSEQGQYGRDAQYGRVPSSLLIGRTLVILAHRPIGEDSVGPVQVDSRASARA